MGLVSAAQSERLLVRQPRWSHVAWPIALLMMVVCGHDFDETLRGSARLHGVSVVLVLMILHLLRPRKGYQWLAAGAGTADGLFLGARMMAAGPHAVELTVVAGGFALLAAGAVISWFKDRLLPRVERVPVTEAQGPELPNAVSQ